MIIGFTGTQQGMTKWQFGQRMIVFWRYEKDGEETVPVVFKYLA
jgi:hypothetical protein